MPTFASASCRHSRVRNHLASLLHRWAYRIEGRRAEHRAGEKVSLEALMRFRNDNMAARLDSWRTDTAVYIAGPMGPAMQAEYERRESRGWN
jgi:hypothetical protein